MIIPVRCVTCGKTIADKWRSFEIATGARRDDALDAGKGKGKGKGQDGAGKGKDGDEAQAESRREAMDRLGLVRYCCRRHFLAQVDLIERI